MYIYPYSVEYAIQHDERGQWRESGQASCDCARAIEKAIHDNYNGSRLSDDAAAAMYDEEIIDADQGHGRDGRMPQLYRAAVQL